MKKKGLVIAASVMLVLCLAVGGTLAWLMDQTDPVVNTFTVGNIDITLTEDEGAVNDNGEHEFKMVPGNTITKDPLITIEAGSEACWLFVEVKESDNFDDYMTYEPATGWTKYSDDGKTAVYYQQIGTAGDVLAATEKGVLLNDTVTVKTSVTKDMMDNIKGGTVTAPTLTFKAYAVQQANVNDVDDAWLIATGQKTA
ncbi:MAG: SipW-dependent-type signal peptide-containing protein [Firmicutes bacterium]|nr:SipW-dependent-type signal peptide-containing protein [Bacillota bacterium]